MTTTTPAIATTHDQTAKLFDQIHSSADSLAIFTKAFQFAPAPVTHSQTMLKAALAELETLQELHAALQKHLQDNGGMP